MLVSLLRGSTVVGTVRTVGYSPSQRWSILGAVLTTAILALVLYGIALGAALDRYLVAMDVMQISVEHSGCMGTCPAYAVSLDAAGRARYVGSAYVRYFGTYETQFNPRLFPLLATQVYRQGFFVKRFSTVAEDAPSTTIAVRFRDGSVVSTQVFPAFGGDTQEGDLADDAYATATLIDGAVGRFCDWHRVQPSPALGVSPGWYSPIELVACKRPWLN